MRTSEFTEANLPRIAKLLGFDNEPKWLTIRFAIGISLAINKPIDLTEKIDLSNGKPYNIEVITGKGKLDITGEQADYHDLMALIIANSDHIVISSEKELEKLLEYHCERGFIILASSMRDNSDIYSWMMQEFSSMM